MPIPKQKVKPPKSAKMRIYETLRDWIIDGTLQPGEKILDSELSDYFSVSRTPVREAMQLLEDQKLIEIFPGRGSRVSGLDVVNIPQAYQMLAALHALAVGFSYPAMTPERVAQLEQLNQEFAQAREAQDRKKQRELDRAFHDTFVRLAGNDFLRSFTDTLYSHVARTENICYEQWSGEVDSAAEHEQILDALRRGDREAAERAMYANWMHTAEALRSGGQDGAPDQGDPGKEMR